MNRKKTANKRIFTVYCLFRLLSEYCSINFVFGVILEDEFIDKPEFKSIPNKLGDINNTNYIKKHLFCCRPSCRGCEGIFRMCRTYIDEMCWFEGISTYPRFSL